MELLRFGGPGAKPLASPRAGRGSGGRARPPMSTWWSTSLESGRFPCAALVPYRLRMRGLL